MEPIKEPSVNNTNISCKLPIAKKDKYKYKYRNRVGIRAENWKAAVSKINLTSTVLKAKSLKRKAIKTARKSKVMKKKIVT